MNLKESTIYSILVSFGYIDSIVTLTDLTYVCADLGIIPKDLFKFKHHPIRLGNYESGCVAETLWSLEVDGLVSTVEGMTFAHESDAVDHPTYYWVSKIADIFTENTINELAVLLAASNMLGIDFKKPVIEQNDCEMLFAGTLIPVDCVRLLHYDLQTLLRRSNVGDRICRV